jgi:hypothetical protein
MTSFMSAGQAKRQGAQTVATSSEREPVGGGGSGSDRPKVKPRAEVAVKQVGTETKGGHMAMHTGLVNLLLPLPLTHAGGDRPPQHLGRADFLTGLARHSGGDLAHFAPTNRTQRGQCALPCHLC